MTCTLWKWSLFQPKGIHTLQLNFLFSDWLFSKYAECIENVHCTLLTAPKLRPDCARCFWCVTARANVDWSIFSLGKVVNDIGRIKIQCACIGFVLFHSKKLMRIYQPLTNGWIKRDLQVSHSNSKIPGCRGVLAWKWGTGMCSPQDPMPSQ